jgi:hypothetical protein
MFFRRLQLVVLGISRLLLVVGHDSLPLQADETPTPQATHRIFLPVIAAARAWRPLSASSPWNTPIPTNAEIDPNSSAMVRYFSTSRGNEYEARLWVNVNRAAPTVWIANGNTPIYDVDCGNPQWCQSLDRTPIPDNAVPDFEWDGHMLILSADRSRSWDMYQARKTATGWAAEWGTAFDLTGTGVQAPGWSSARASGVPLAAGLIFYESIRAGRIEHALAFSFSYPGPCFVSPASIGGGLYTGADNMPMGARLQLDPALDLNSLGLSPAAKIIARALQEYGMIVVDQGAANPGFYAESFHGKPNNPWAGVLTERDLLNIPTDRFRVLKLGSQNCTPY